MPLTPILAPGSLAPDFTLKSHLDGPVCLHESLERGNVLLVFYPGDFAPT